MDIAGNRWRRERKEFMHPRYARARIFALVRKNKGFMTVCQSDFFVSQVMCRDRKFESLFRQLRRKSIAEKAALSKQEIAEIKTRRLELQVLQTLPENLADLPQGCDWGGKRDSKGKTSYWYHFRDVQTLF